MEYTRILMQVNPDPNIKHRRHAGRLKAAVSVRLVAAVLLAAFALSGCSALPFGGGQPRIKDGVLTLDGVTLDFGGNGISDESETSLTVLKPGAEEGPDGLASELYELNMKDVCDEPITVTLKYDGESPVDDNEAELVLGIGTTVEMDACGGTDTFYRYIPVDLINGVATAEFTPSDYAQTTVHGDSNTGSSAPYMERTSFGLFWITSTYTDGGHFKVYMPLQAHTFYLNYNERCALLDDLESIYSDYLAKGYTYSKRSEWPMNVTIKNLQTVTEYVTGKSGALGYYSYGYNGAAGEIFLNREQFDNGYATGSITPLLAHEFFHFVQLNYVDVGSDLLWFDEATATFYESTKMSNAIPSIVGEYKELIFSGVYPEDNTAGNGYCRMPLIKFLSNLRGEEFIRNAYTTAGSGSDWDSALLSAAGPPSEWADDFYEALVSGKVSDYSPYTVHKNLVEGMADGLGATVELVMPEADEVSQLQADGEPVLMGKTTVHVGEYGAQLVALTISADELKKLPDGTDPIVKVSGGNLRVFAILGKNFKVASDPSGVTLSDFKKVTTENYQFLVLVTDLDGSGGQDIAVTVEIEPYPTLDELVGEYPGSSLTYTEVYISDTLKESIASESAADSDKDAGCDIEILAMLEALEGQAQPTKIIIRKTGDSTGTLVWLDEDGAENTPLPFTYAAGKVTFDYTSSGASVSQSLDAAYGKNNDVTINGTLLLTYKQYPNDFYIKVLLNGSKTLSTP